eukprot:16437520-Heterocapsa_arctica.AAC.1
MALFPSKGMVVTMADLAAVRAWVGVARMIINPGTQIRNLAMLPHSVVDATIAATWISWAYLR